MNRNALMAAFLMAMIATPAVAAQTTSPPAPCDTDCQAATGKIKGWSDTAAIIGGSIAFLLLTGAVIMYMVSGGNEQRRASSINGIKSVVVGAALLGSIAIILALV